MLPHKRSGFTLLYIDDREEYIENVAVVLFVPQSTLSSISISNQLATAPSSSQQPQQPQQTLIRNLQHPVFPTKLTTHTGISGRLHICSKSLYFASDDQRYPIIKFPLQFIQQYTQFISSSDDTNTPTPSNDQDPTSPYPTTSHSSNHFDSANDLFQAQSTIQPNDPYLFFIASQLISFFPNSPHIPVHLDVNTIHSEFLIFGAHGHNLVQFLKLIKKLYDIESLRYSPTSRSLFIQGPPGLDEHDQKSNQTQTSTHYQKPTPQHHSQQQQVRKKEEKKKEDDGIFGGLFSGFFSDSKTSAEKKRAEDARRKREEQQRQEEQRLEQEKRNQQHHHQHQHQQQQQLQRKAQNLQSSPQFDISADELLKAFLQARQLSVPFDITLISDLHEIPLLTLSTFEAFYIHAMCCQLGFEPPQSIFYNSTNNNNVKNNPQFNSINPNPNSNTGIGSNSSSNSSNNPQLTTSLILSNSPNTPPSPHISMPSMPSTPSSTSSTSQNYKYHHSNTPQSQNLHRSQLTPSNEPQTVESIDRHISALPTLQSVSHIDTLFSKCRSIQSYFYQSKSSLEKTNNTATIIVNLITPLVKVPGRLYLTTQKLYYIPFNDISADTHSIPLTNILFLHKRRYASREIGLEIMLRAPSASTASSSSFRADYLNQNNAVNASTNDSSNTGQTIMNNLFYNTTSVYIIVENHFIRDLLYEIITRQDVYQQHEHPTLESCLSAWVNGRISNFDYLLLLNHFSGRSLSDLSQYPVMPWVLSNYDSFTLDLNDPNNYRDLSKPVGALNPTRLESFRQRYQSMLSLQEHSHDMGMEMFDPHTPNHHSDHKSPHQHNNNKNKHPRDQPHGHGGNQAHLHPPTSKQSFAHLMANPKPFMYGTHFSTPGYVVSFLLRSKPLYFLKLQSGAFDKPERLFQDIRASYMSALNSPADVRELIPQFYDIDGLINDQPNSTSSSSASSSQANPTAFLSNFLHLDLGITQSGREISNVELPNWANSEYEFIATMRKALESDYVSHHLHLWIDLIWGYAQQGQEAIKHDNLFFPLTYEGVIDLDLVSDEKERVLIETQMVEFGQTPKQLFLQPHPKKYSPIHSIHWDQLVRNVQATNSLCYTDTTLIGSQSIVKDANGTHSSAQGQSGQSITPRSYPQFSQGSGSHVPSNFNSSNTNSPFFGATPNGNDVVIDESELTVRTKFMPKDMKQRRANKQKQLALEQEERNAYRRQQLELQAQLGTDFETVQGQSGRDTQEKPSSTSTSDPSVRPNPNTTINNNDSPNNTSNNNNNEDDDEFMNDFMHGVSEGQDGLISTSPSATTDQYFQHQDIHGQSQHQREYSENHFSQTSDTSSTLSNQFEIDRLSFNDRNTTSSIQDDNSILNLQHQLEEYETAIQQQNTQIESPGPESTENVEEAQIPHKNDQVGEENDDTPAQLSFLSFSTFPRENETPILRFGDLSSSAPSNTNQMNNPSSLHRSTGQLNFGAKINNTNDHNNDQGVSQPDSDPLSHFLQFDTPSQEVVSLRPTPTSTFPSPAPFASHSDSSRNQVSHHPGQPTDIYQLQWENDSDDNLDHLDSDERRRKSTLIDVTYNIPSTHPNSSQPCSQDPVTPSNVWSKSPHTHSLPIKLPSQINTICIGSKYTIGLTKEDNILRVFRTQSLQLIIQHKVSTLPLISCILLDAEGIECLLGDNEGILYVYNVDAGSLSSRFLTQHNNVSRLFSTLSTPQTIFTAYKRAQQLDPQAINSNNQLLLSLSGFYSDRTMDSLTLSTSGVTDDKQIQQNINTQVPNNNNNNTNNPTHTHHLLNNLLAPPPPPLSLTIATNGADCSVKLWTLTRNAPGNQNQGLNISHSQSLSHSGSLSALTTLSQSPGYSSFTLTQRHEIVSHNTPLYFAAFTPDNKCILTLDEDFVVIFTTTNGDELFTIDLSDHIDPSVLRSQSPANQSQSTQQQKHNLVSERATIFFPILSSDCHVYPSQELLQQYQGGEYISVVLLHQLGLGVVLGHYGEFLTQFSISFNAINPSSFTTTTTTQHSDHSAVHNNTHATTTSSSSSPPHIVNITYSGNTFIVGYANGFLRCYQYNHDKVHDDDNKVIACLWQKQISTVLITFQQSILSQQLPYISSTLYASLHNTTTNTTVSKMMYNLYKQHYSILAILHGQSSQLHKMCLFSPMIRCRRDEHEQQQQHQQSKLQPSKQ